MNFDILEAWYGQTDKDEEFLRKVNERSILKGVCDSDLIKALEALIMLQIDTG